ncbi:MAG TPA: PAS domain-containing sensor histidine kinase [Casimicrobiaceae bacterium]|nr:PAS domain-containing sensor histidine kinase [Casimicrobiaceae bacterium]
MSQVTPGFRRFGEALFALLVETVEDYAIFAMDADGTIVHWNAGAARITGYSEEDILGQQIDILFTPEQIAEGAPARELQVARDTGRAEDERWHMRKDGGRFFALGIVVPLRKADGSLVGFGKILRDRTDIKEMQETLKKRTERLEEEDRQKNRFLATLSHELRNPLAPLTNAVAILRVHSRNAPRLLPIVDLMDRQLDRLEGLVDDLLDVTRITQGKLRLRKVRMDLTQVVREAADAIRISAESRNVTVTLAAPPDPVFVEGDRQRLLQVFGNLLENAAKFTPEGGSISAVVDDETPEAVVRVRDTGVGIRPEDAERIFELFTQGSVALDEAREGLGLGLAIVRDLVAMHGGSVQAQSAGVDKGSEFIVRLPAIVAETR